MKKIFAIVLALCIMAMSAAFAEDVIKVAVAAPMTGDNAEYGIGFANAAKPIIKGNTVKQAVCKYLI